MNWSWLLDLQLWLLKLRDKSLTQEEFDKEKKEFEKIKDSLIKKGIERRTKEFIKKIKSSIIYYYCQKCSRRINKEHYISLLINTYSKDENRINRVRITCKFCGAIPPSNGMDTIFEIPHEYSIKLEDL